MKKIIGFMLIISLFGIVATANASTVTELTEDQMAQQFGGTIFDPENCEAGGYDVELIDFWYENWFHWGGACNTTAYSINFQGSYYNVVCVCVSALDTFYYVCKTSENQTNDDFEALEEEGTVLFFDENTYDPWPW